MHQQDLDRKRREAENRNRKHQLLKPLKSRLQKIENRLEEVLAEKSKVEDKLAGPAIYDSAKKKQLLEALDQQTELTNEENTLTKEWDKLSIQIEQAKTASSFNN